MCSLRLDPVGTREETETTSFWGPDRDVGALPPK